MGIALFRRAAFCLRLSLYAAFKKIVLTCTRSAYVKVDKSFRRKI